IPVAAGEELAKRVAYYIDHPAERAQRVQLAFEYARTLTWKRTGEAYLQFWEERLAKPQHHRTRRGWLFESVSQKRAAGFSPRGASRDDDAAEGGSFRRSKKPSNSPARPCGIAEK
ncbi:unnamed protein product, partial [marine sediment metagenome]